MWPAFGLPAGTSRAEELAARRRLAHEDAKLTASLGGNMIRSFWSVAGMFTGDPAGLAAALEGTGGGPLGFTPVSLRHREERIGVLDRANEVLDHLMSALSGEDDQYTFDLGPIDAALSGVEDFNRSSTSPVQILLSLVAGPPRFLLEAPAADVLRWWGRPYTFESLWVRYLRLHEHVHQLLVRRYVKERPDTGVIALEIVNEPDYLWIPEEMKLETCGNPLLGPNWKYVTELHIPSVPSCDRPAPPFEVMPFGAMDQEGAWCDYVAPDPPGRCSNSTGGRNSTGT